MHLARWTPEQLADTGYSHTAYVEAYRRMIDAHAAAFQKSMVFLNVGGHNNQTINDYAAMHGIHFRQDGLKPGGASYNCGEWLYKAYAKRGVLCNFEFHSGYKSMVAKKWGLPETIDAALDAPISYLNMNLGTFGKESPAIVQEQLRRAAMKVGYRLRPLEVTHTPQISVSAERKGRFLVQSTWRNEGVAAPTRSLAIRWMLRGQDGKVVATALTYPEVPTTAWWAGTDYAVDDVMSVPPGTPAGTYRLDVAMVDPEAEQTINLAIEGRQDDGSYALGEVVAKVRTAPAQSLLYAESFEDGLGAWAASAAGIEVAVAKENAHEGRNSLRVLGTKGKAWNYATATIPGDVPAFSLCRLTAWMKVDKLAPAKFVPYLKIAANEADGKWITNFNSNRYDTKALGTWQKLTVLAELPGNVGQLALAIETGSLELPITIDMQLDDLRLEILEQP
jgi:hypothetical protein